MNVALPALIVFLLLLPGFIFRIRLKRAERTSLDYSPFGQVVVEAVLWTVLAHSAWLFISCALFSRCFEPAVIMMMLSSNPKGQAQATTAVANNFRWIAIYFITLLFVSYSVPKGIRFLISKYRLDREGGQFSPIFRFHQAPWYYLLTKADFPKGEEPDFIVVSAIVDVAGQALLYTGVLDEFFVDSDGQLDRVVLQEVMRRPMNADKPST